MPSSKGWRGRRDERTMQDTPIGDVVDGLLRERTFARGLPIGRLASESAPVSLEGGVLVVATSTGPWGAQARFLAREIASRANRSLGSELVRTVQIVVRPEPRKGL